MDSSNSTIASLLEKAINDQFTPPEVMTRVVLRKVKDAGIRLSTSEKQRIRDVCKRSWRDGDFSGLNKLRIQRRRRRGKDLKVRIDEKDVDELFRMEMRKIEAAIPNLLRQISLHLHPEYREKAEIGRLAHLYEAERFQARLSRTYRKPFDTLGRFLVACINAGQTFLDSLAQDGELKQTPRRVALLRLHHRACRVSSEIEALLHAGLTDGAFARWRTLHEICVCAAFINKQGDNVARRFLRHETFDRLKLDGLAKRQANLQVTDDHDQLIALLKSTYGAEYVADYGWCAKALGKARVTFRDLEEATDFGHVRLHYQQSNNAVHLTSLSLIYRPSLNQITAAGDPMEWAIASNLGLSMPADLCAWSLLNVTLALLGAEMTADHIVLMHLLSKIRREVAADFMRAEKRILDREERLKAKRSAA
ncbi:MAG TPA: DUF5677 domain-containing protein [Rhodanobacteraceae bacterium]|nr:DUF5677 domain-containing protein [Rhodanobacteraceae bacterium]